MVLGGLLADPIAVFRHGVGPDACDGQALCSPLQRAAGADLGAHWRGIGLESACCLRQGRAGLDAAHAGDGAPLWRPQSLRSGTEHRCRLSLCHDADAGVFVAICGWSRRPTTRATAGWSKSNFATAIPMSSHMWNRCGATTNNESQYIRGEGNHESTSHFCTARIAPGDATLCNG